MFTLRDLSSNKFRPLPLGSHLHLNVTFSLWFFGLPPWIVDPLVTPTESVEEQALRLSDAGNNSHSIWTRSQRRKHN
jgi:hypothetical protein